VLKAPHHGSANSNSPELLTALRPQVAIVSCGRGNRFGHPPPSVLARYAAAGATVYRTDLHGAITVETDGKTVNVTPFVAPLPASPLTPARAIADWLRATQFHER
jgi:competence protein ComEC